MKAKHITQKRLDNLRLEVELDNINQNANLTMAPIKQQMLKPSDMKYLVSEPEETQLGFNADVLDVGRDEQPIRRIRDVDGYQDPDTRPTQQQLTEFIEGWIDNRPPWTLASIRGTPFYKEWTDIRDEIEGRYPQHPTKRQRTALRQETKDALDQWLLDNTDRIDDYVLEWDIIPNRFGSSNTKEDIENSNLELLNDQNEQRKKNYVDRIQNTNLGAYSTQKLEGESDENYIQRMQSLKASLPTPQRAVAMEKEREKLQFRNYLSVVASPTVAETIINHEFFKGGDGEEHVRLLVRAWPSFLKELKETYTKLDVDSFLDFAQSWVDKIQTTKGVKNPVNVEPEVVVDSQESYLRFAKRLSPTKIQIRNTKGNKLELTPDRSVRKNSFLNYPEFYDLLTYMDDGKRISSKAKYIEGFAILQAQIPLDDDEFGIAGGDDGGGGGGGGYFAGGEGFKQSAKPTPKHRKKYGHGISAKSDEPEYREFGRLIVSMPKLSDGILRVLYASNGINIAGIKSTHISEDFKDLIMTIIDTGKFNNRLFEKLPNSEKPLFKKLIDVAKLKYKLGAGNLVDENEKQQLQRWELVRGELESGNDNISLKKEAKKLISYFMKSGRLSKSEAFDLLIQLSL